MTSQQIIGMIKCLVLIGMLFPGILFAQNGNQEEHFGYRVSRRSKTVIQIARDVYNDERLWKKIAYWNNLVAPYTLSVGQVLVLPQKPKRSLEKENQVASTEVPQPTFLNQLPSVSQVILHRNGYYVYEVNERAPSLSMVALENYGDKSMSRKIARWNGLSPTEHLSLSQKLILHEKPRLSTQNANQVLIKEWLRVGNAPMAHRLGHTDSERPVAKPTPEKMGIPSEKTAEPAATQASEPKPAKKTEHLPASVAEPTAENDNRPLPQKKVQAVTVEPTHLGQPIAQPPELAPQVAPAQPEKPTPVESPTAAQPAAVETTSHSVALPPVQVPVSAPSVALPSVAAPAPTAAPTAATTAAPATAPTAEINSDPELQQPTAQPAQAPVQPAQAPAQSTTPQQAHSQNVKTEPQQATPVAAPAAIPEQPPLVRRPSTAPVDPMQLPEPTSESYWLGSDTNRLMKTFSKDPKGK